MTVFTRARQMNPVHTLPPCWGLQWTCVHKQTAAGRQPLTVCVLVPGAIRPPSFPRWQTAWQVCRQVNRFTVSIFQIPCEAKGCAIRNTGLALQIFASLIVSRLLFLFTTFWSFSLHMFLYLKVKLSLNRPCRPRGLWDVEAPTFSRHPAQRWRFVSLRRRSFFTPRKIPGTNFR
jgi:hypothetical protein